MGKEEFESLLETWTDASRESNEAYRTYEIARLEIITDTAYGSNEPKRTLASLEHPKVQELDEIRQEAKAEAVKAWLRIQFALKGETKIIVNEETGEVL